jgi:DNA sulfur modification protein DndB
MVETYWCVRGRMGDWVYYVTVMKMGKIADTCKFAEQIHPNKDLDALIQRSIGDRVQKEMVPYLLTEKQRFFGSLVIAVYGGDPEFSEVKVAEHDLLNDTDSSSYGFGLLRFDGGQTYYALDGQHRLSAIKEATSQRLELRNEEVSVIIIKHETSPAGMERTRRLFATLNQHAKPTSAGMNIAINEDDSIAIVTRRLVKENEQLKKLVLADASSINSKQLNPSKKNDPYITTLAALYECNEMLLAGYGGGLTIDKSFKQFRQPYDKLDAYYQYLEKLWMRMLEKCPGFDQVLDGTRKPGELRLKRTASGSIVTDDKSKPIPGGSIFARPMGQFIVCEVIRNASVQDRDPLDTIDAIMANVSMDVDERPWTGAIWNASSRTIKGSASDRKLLAEIISYALSLKTTSKHRELLQKYKDTVENQKATFPVKDIEWSGTVAEEESEYVPEATAETPEATE